MGPDGRATIEYWINATGLDSASIGHAEGAIAAAFSTWQRAAPTLLFVYRGRTNRPAVPGDATNVVEFQGTNTTGITVTNGRPEFDMHFTPLWVWEPCEQRDGSCTPIGKAELQSIATHEAGHALWLSHPRGPAERDRLMSMWPGDANQGGERFWQTLALGDVLGIRELYPCSCPLPTIYDP